MLGFVRSSRAPASLSVPLHLSSSSHRLALLVTLVTTLPPSSPTTVHPTLAIASCFVHPSVTQIRSASLTRFSERRPATPTPWLPCLYLTPTSDEYRFPLVVWFSRSHGRLITIFRESPGLSAFIPSPSLWIFRLSDASHCFGGHLWWLLLVVLMVNLWPCFYCFSLGAAFAIVPCLMVSVLLWRWVDLCGCRR